MLIPRRLLLRVNIRQQMQLFVRLDPAPLPSVVRRHAKQIASAAGTVRRLCVVLWDCFSHECHLPSSYGRRNEELLLVGVSDVSSISFILIVLASSRSPALPSIKPAGLATTVPCEPHAHAAPLPSLPLLPSPRRSQQMLSACLSERFRQRGSSLILHAP